MELISHENSDSFMELQLCWTNSMHEAGYVHGDIKKENIIFNDDKDISYLIDFDLAKKEGGKYPEGFRFFEGVS